MQYKINSADTCGVINPTGDNQEESIVPTRTSTTANPDFPDEVQLWQDFRNGDRNALSNIYQKTVKSLLNYGQKFIPDKEVVADLIQDLFVELWNQRTRLSSTTSIKYYLLKSLRYKIIRHLNRNKDFVVKNGISDDYHFELVFSYEHVLVEEGMAAEQKEKLAYALTKLTQRQKEAIYLRFYNNLSYSQISSLMLLSEQSAYNLISKALKVLQKHMLHYAYLLWLISFLS